MEASPSSKPLLHSLPVITAEGEWLLLYSLIWGDGEERGVSSGRKGDLGVGGGLSREDCPRKEKSYGAIVLEPFTIYQPSIIMLCLSQSM